MIANTSEEDHPAGWTVHFTLLRSGRKVKCYGNSAGTGRKLYSKKEVIQYVKAQRTLPSQPQPTKKSMAVKRHSKNNQLSGIVEDANQHPNWLPRGWIVDFKTRNSGLRSGEIYKCYIDPSTGFRFYSKPEVFRYLKTMKQNRCASEMETSIPMQQTSEVQIERSTVEDLPAGWIKELKIRRNGDRIRRDPYYKDPVTGYIFRSKRDVQRYLETGEISRHAFLPKERDIMDKPSVHPSPESKRPKLEHTATKRQLNAEKLDDEAKQSPKDGVKVNGTVFKENSNTTYSAPSMKGPDMPLRFSKRLAGCEPQLVTSSVSSAHAKTMLLVPTAVIRDEKHTASKNVINNGARSNENSNDKKGLCLPLRSSKRLAGLEPGLLASSMVILTKKCPKQNVIDDGVESKEHSNDRKVMQWAPRSSKRLAGLEPELVSTSVAIGQAEPKPELVTSSLFIPVETRLKPNVTSNGSESKDNSNDKKGLRLPLRSSKRLAGVESESSVQALQNGGIVSSKREPLVAIEATMADAVSELHEAECRTAILCHAPRANNSFDGETSNKSQNSVDGQAVKKTSIYCCKSKPRKELYFPRRSSKRLSGLQPLPISIPISNERAFHIGATNSNKTKAILAAGAVPDSLADKAAQQVKAGPEVADLNTTLRKESSENRKEPLDDQTATKAKSENPETEKMNNDKPELQVAFSLGDFWSDPCLEFAFKTLTGAIPIDHYQPIQSYFQQQVNASETLRNTNLQHQVDPSQPQKEVSLAPPDLGLPSFDISGYFGDLEKQSGSQPQCTLNSCSFLRSGNVTLPSCSSITFQQPHWEGNKSLSRKANSLLRDARIT